MEKTEGRYELPERFSTSGGPLLTTGELLMAIIALLSAGPGESPRAGPGDPEAPSDMPTDRPPATRPKRP